MPEIPDLEIIKEILERKALGRTIVGAEIVRPLVLRNLDPTLDTESFLVDRTIEAVERRGKFLIEFEDRFRTVTGRGTFRRATC